MAVGGGGNGSLYVGYRADGKKKKKSTVIGQQLIGREALVARGAAV